MKKKWIGVVLFCMLLLCMAPTALAAEQKDYPYYVTVNLTKNIVTVYEKDAAGAYTVPKKAFLCSAGESTPEGSFQTMVKYDWRYLFGDVWGQYATRITGHYLFHSVPYLEQEKNTLEYEEYNKLGTTASMGCIRLTVRDAKWIYDHCPIGTTVTLYRGDVEEPLAPAAVQKLNPQDLERRGWDPTDPDAKNPWKEGEVREMTVQPALFECELQAYYENGVYYLSAEDAKKVFSKLNIALDLSAYDQKVKAEEVTVSENGKTMDLTCRRKGDTVYYKMRELAKLVDAEMNWEKETKTIEIRYGAESITVSQKAASKDTETLTQKLVSLFHA